MPALAIGKEEEILPQVFHFLEISAKNSTKI